MKKIWNKQTKKNQKGVALLLVVFSVVLISFIVTEVLYETSIDYAISSQSIRRLKAYYAARSGLELGLLRIKLYTKIQTQFGKSLGPMASQLNLIWSFPFAWPPMLPKDMGGMNKDLLDKKIKESKMDASYSLTIMDEGARIDINELNSKSKTLQNATKEQILNLLKSKKEDIDWVNMHPNFRPDEVLNNIIDWIDSDKESLNGGDEKHYYENLESSEFLPPNRSFRSIGELRMVAGMSPDIFALLENQITVHGMKGINPNQASAEVLKSFDSTITNAVALDIIKRRNSTEEGGPFKDANEFWSFVNSRGANVSAEKQEQILLIFDAVYNFRIRSTGEFQGSIREIEVITLDLGKAADQVASYIKKEASSTNGGSGGSGATSAQTGGSQTGQQGSGSSSNAKPLPKGPPRIIYWSER